MSGLNHEILTPQKFSPPKFLCIQSTCICTVRVHVHAGTCIVAERVSMSNATCACLYKHRSIDSVLVCCILYHTIQLHMGHKFVGSVKNKAELQMYVVIGSF